MPSETVVGAADYYDLTKDKGDAAADMTYEDMLAAGVGVEAPDDYTLVFTCTSPCPYFDTVAAYNSFYPASEDLIKELGVEGFRACDYTTMWYNGPYLMALPSSAPTILMWRTLLMVWASTTTSSSQKMRLAPRRCLPEKTEPGSATTSAVRWIAGWKRVVILRRIKNVPSHKCPSFINDVNNYCANCAKQNVKCHAVYH